MTDPIICVIFNPAAGKDRAARRLEALRRQWGQRLTWRATERPGHAADLARAAADEGFATVAAAGGDGTVHEVASGLLRSARTDVRFAVIPVGSANDFAYSLLHPRDAPVDAIDVGRARAEDGREKFFLCNLGLGFNGAVTVESRRIKWLQGMALYGLATWRALWRHYACPLMEFSIDDEPAWSAPTLLFSVLLGKREGGFELAPHARLDDGLFDYVHAGPLSRWQVLRLLPRLALFGPPEHPQIRIGQFRRMRVKSAAPLNVHLDGEFLCTADEGLREIEAELLPRRLKVDMDFMRTP